MIDLTALKKSQELIRGGDAGGVYIPKETGNKNPNLHYGIVIDCGSSGSRLYIYVWPDHSGKANELLQIKQLLDVDGKPVVKKLEPGEFCSFIKLIFLNVFFENVRSFFDGPDAIECNGISQIVIR